MEDLEHYISTYLKRLEKFNDVKYAEELKEPSFFLSEAFAKLGDKKIIGK